jgi:hypothetical protein
MPNGSPFRLYSRSSFLIWIVSSSRPLPSSSSVHRSTTGACSLPYPYTDTTFVYQSPTRGFGEHDFIPFVSLSPCNFLRERYQHFCPIIARTCFLLVHLALQIKAFTISIDPTVTSGFPATATWFLDHGDPSSFGLMQRSLQDNQVKGVTGVSNGEGASSGTVQITFNQVG